MLPPHPEESAQRPSRRMRRPAPSCFETAASPPPQHEESEIGFSRFRQSKCASRINPTYVVKPAGDGGGWRVPQQFPRECGIPITASAADLRFTPPARFATDRGAANGGSDLALALACARGRCGNADACRGRFGRARPRAIHGPNYHPPYADIVIDDKSNVVLHEV